MSNHQWLRGERHAQVVGTTRMEMLSVLRCAAKLAQLEGLHGTAQRLTNDAERLEALLNVGPVTIEVVQ